MPQDIYRTRERERGLSAGAYGPSAPRRELPPPRSSVWPVIVALALLVFLLALGSVVYFQQRLLRDQRRLAQERGAEVNAPVPLSIAALPAPGVSFDPAAQMTMDDFTALVPDNPPPGERPPLTAHWLLQAAYQLRQADTSYRRGGWSAAATAYRQALRIVPEIEDVDARLGLCLLRQQEYAEAEPSLARAVERQAGVAAHRNNLGVALMGQGKNTEAEAAFRAALEGNPGYVAARRNLALLKYRAGDMAAAAELFAETLKLTAEDPDGAHMLSIALIRTERWPEAVSLLQDSARRWPEVPPVRFRLAQALAHFGDAGAAMESLQKGVSLIDPSRALAWLSRTDFDILRGREDFQRLIEELSTPRR